MPDPTIDRDGLTADMIFEFYDQAIERPDPTLTADYERAVAELGAARDCLRIAEDKVSAARAALGAQRARARAIVLDRLYVKLDDDGCPVPRPGAPRGPRTPRESKPPVSPPEAPPTPTGAGGAGEAVALFAAAIQDRAPQADLDALGWTKLGAGGALTDKATRVVVKHQLPEMDVTGWDDEDTPVAFGRAWSMDDEPREVES